MLARWAVKLAVPSVEESPLATFLIITSGAFGWNCSGSCCSSGCSHPISARCCSEIGILGIHSILSTIAMEACGGSDGQPTGLAVGCWVATLLAGQLDAVWGRWLETADDCQASCA